MSLRNEQCNKVCRILDDVLANRPTERDTLITAVRTVFDAPTIKPERKTGKWMPTICNSDGMHHEWCGFHCSICKKATVICHNYCPRCGARMEGGEHE